MSYYASPVAGPVNHWYRSTLEENYAHERRVLDAIWNDRCDAVLKTYVFRYGVFFTAFTGEIIEKLREIFGPTLPERVRHGELYLEARASEIENVRAYLTTSHRRSLNLLSTCSICMETENTMECHPDLIRQYGLQPKYCYSCHSITKRYQRFEDSVQSLLPCVLRKKRLRRLCGICRKSFIICDDLFLYGSFGKKAVDFLYPNLFAQICQKCFNRIFLDYSRGSKKLRASRLQQFCDSLGFVPTQDFARLFFRVRDQETMIEFVRSMQYLRTPQGYKSEYGSFFEALVRSGVLPEGSLRQSRGTRVLAKDGHVCHSLGEKEIDDFLFNQNVAHCKEVNYPFSRWRADWAVTTGNQRQLIEYFGMLNNAEYQYRAYCKQRYAKQCGIELIVLTPGEGWREELSKRLRLTRATTREFI